MAIYLVRHAESEANINGRTASHTSIRLSQNGVKQAEHLIHQLPKIDAVIVSKYIRTLQTAQPIIDYYKLDAEIDPNLHEFSYLSEAKCANTTLEERKEWVNDYWTKMDPHHQDGIDAESFSQFYTRVVNFAERLKKLALEYSNKNVLVVSHGQFIQLLMMYVNQSPLLTLQLMASFRAELLQHPIKNVEIFHYSCNGIEKLELASARVEKSKD